MFSQTRL